MWCGVKEIKDRKDDDKFRECVLTEASHFTDWATAQIACTFKQIRSKYARLIGDF